MGNLKPSCADTKHQVPEESELSFLSLMSSTLRNQRKQYVTDFSGSLDSGPSMSSVRVSRRYRSKAITQGVSKSDFSIYWPPQKEDKTHE
jgi:hypothetical protein